MQNKIILEKSDSLNITSGAENRNSEANNVTDISNKSFFGSSAAPGLFQQKMIIKNLMRKEFGDGQIINPKGKRFLQIKQKFNFFFS